jgi:hypothetical protein
MVNAHSVFSGTQGQLRIIQYSHSFSFRLLLSGLSLQPQELRFKAQMEFDGSIGNSLPNRQMVVLFPEAHYAQG